MSEELKNILNESKNRQAQIDRMEAEVLQMRDAFKSICDKFEIVQGSHSPKETAVVICKLIDLDKKNIEWANIELGETSGAEGEEESEAYYQDKYRDRSSEVYRLREENVSIEHELDVIKGLYAETAAVMEDFRQRMGVSYTFGETIPQLIERIILKQNHENKMAYEDGLKSGREE
ncbi:hypothetical protein CMI47_08660 [Candidatus Pacearchaeota archaeon]|nr:hypothetical protein [Candidatus Pacearchaeota archaeon]